MTNATTVKERPIIFSGEMLRAILEGRKTQTRRPIKRQPGHGLGYMMCRDGTALINGPDYPDDESDVVKCPYGVSGDQSWQHGTPQTGGWYYVDGLGNELVWLSRFLPENYPGEDVDPGVLWGKDEKDDPEAIEIEGLSLEFLRWKRPGDRLWVRETWQAWIDGSPEYPDDCDVWEGKIKDAEDQLGRGGIEYKATSESIGPWRSPIFMPRWASRILLEVTGVRVERVNEITYEECQAEGVAVPMMKLWPDPFGVGTQYFHDLWDKIYAKKPEYQWAANPWVWVIDFKVIETEKGTE